MIKTSNHRWLSSYLLILLVMIVAGFLRFFMLTNQSLWFDEGLSLTNSDVSTLQESIARVRQITNSDRFQPLYFIVLFLWRQLFGNSEFVLRSFSALLGISSTIVIFFTALQIYGKKHAFWSLLIMTFSSFCVYYSQEVRHYSLLIFIASLQIYLFSNILTKKPQNQGISKLLFGILTALGIFANINMCCFTASLCLSQIAIYRNVKQWLQWWIPAALFCLPSILYHLTLPGATDPETIAISRLGFPIIQNIIFVVYGLLVGTTYGPSMEQLHGDDRVMVALNYWPHILLLLIVSIVIFLAIVRVLLRHYKKGIEQHPDYFFASVTVLGFLLGLLLAIVTKMNWVPRHSFYLWIPLAILIPSALSQKSSFSSKPYRLSYFAQIAVTFLIILNIYSLFNYYFNYDYYKDDYRSAVAYLIKQRSPSTQSILLWGNQRLLKYYGDIATLDGNKLGLNLREGRINGKFGETVEKLTNNVNTVFLVINREHYFPKVLIEKEMSALYKLDSQENFAYFKIYRFNKKIVS